MCLLASAVGPRLKGRVSTFTLDFSIYNSGNNSKLQVHLNRSFSTSTIHKFKLQKNNSNNLDINKIKQLIIPLSKNAPGKRIILVNIFTK